jgi:pentatricopeptide repeat protein
MTPARYHIVSNGNDGERRIANFTNLHAALQTPTDPEAIWKAYQEIYKFPEDYEFLSEDILRLIIMHFKKATTPGHKLDMFNPHHATVNQTYYARIVAILNHKRQTRMRFIGWDYSDLMSALNRLKRYEDSLKEFDRALCGKVKVSAILLNHAVRAWGGLGQLEKALQALKDIPVQYQFKASEYTLGYVIQQLIITGRPQEALTFWNDLTQDGTMEDIETANGILRACVQVRASRFAQIVYDDLPRLKIESNLGSLNQMLSLAVMEIQHLEERNQFLQGVHDKMMDKERVFDRVLLGSILTNFSKKGDVESAITVHRLMSLYEYPPGIEEYNDILHGFARLGQMDKAIEWFQHMRQVGVRPNRPSYVILMQAYVLKRFPRETEALFRQLVRDGLEPDLAVCNFLLLAYEQARMNRRCLQLYKTMLLNPSIGVDQFTFSCMFNAVFHNHKALLEGSEGIDGQGSTLTDTGFLAKIDVPFGPSIHASYPDTTALEDKDINPQASPDHLQTQPPRQHQYQFDQATSTTESLNPRTIFRDMIIVGIGPTRSLYANILRAFLSQQDFAGASVATRALVDHYMLKPSPKMTAIIVAWVSKEMEKEANNKENDHIKGELSKLVHMMSRSRGLVEMLEKVVAMKHGSPSGVPSESMDPITVARMEMGGDLVDLTLSSVLARSSWNTVGDNPIQIDLKDFEQWYRVYTQRTHHVEVDKKGT